MGKFMTRSEELATWVPHLKKAYVGCIGDIMLDRFVYGVVERISPEGPIPVLRIEREMSTLGGVGNVARNLASLGAKFYTVSVVGGDTAGEDIKRLLQELGGCESHVLTISECATTVKTRYIAGNQQIVRVDRETDVLEDDDIAAQVINQSFVNNELKVLVLSDYGKGVLTKDVTQKLIRQAKQRQQTIIIDPKGSDYSRYMGATIVTPNRLELSQASGMTLKTDQDIINAAQNLIANFDFEAIVATLSEKGMMVVTRSGSTAHLPAEAKEVYDVSGAGDTVVATMAAALSIGLPLLEAAKLANVAAGIVVGKVGTAVVSANELFHMLRSYDVLASEKKEVSIDELDERLQQWRMKGHTIGFTNGCFDLLHPGHVTLLSKAAAKVDRLVVGLNSDQSIKRLKGSERPIQNELARATVLASLASVDLVVVFEEDTPQKLIEIVRPDILVKGSDYTVETVVGADFVQSYGGEVMLVDLVPEQSTTRLVQRMHSNNSPCIEKTY
jgi:D-beta-D-heptose 7-phosphate kinase / D-beta-D-heptose 1-phosphate adenosyltransferase